MLITNTVYRDLLEVLRKRYDLTRLSDLCIRLVIPPESIVVIGDTLDQATNRMVTYCQQRSLVETLIGEIERDFPNDTLVSRLSRLVINQDNSYIFVSSTPDLIEHTKKVLDWRKNPRVKWSYDWVIDPVLGDTVSYCGNLRSEIGECAVFIGLIGKEIGDYLSDLQRSRFEIEYDCAFFKGLEIYLFILNSATDDEVRRRINRIRRLQTHNASPSHVLQYDERNDLEFWNKFQDILMSSKLN
jgi:hypothetical protein